jgi:transcription initiation factor IIE alpha subunit
MECDYDTEESVIEFYCPSCEERYSLCEAHEEELTTCPKCGGEWEDV